jgi:metal-responsive CopG/Arc/MetJ family transcriptional regulator
MERITISISKKLYEDILRIVNSNRYKFNSVEDCIEKILKEVLVNYTPSGSITTQDSITNDISNEKEDMELKDRLKKLGYI